MPSLEDSKTLVRNALAAGPDHATILASLREEIDDHNRERSARRRRHDGSHEGREESALRFRFKHDKYRSVKGRRRRKHHDASQERSPKVIVDTTDQEIHPFPREPTTIDDEPSDDAFLSSILDALVDDEAASYWESVYSQPIHTYERPSVRTATGGVEYMSDDEYAAWIKQKMWEKQHPKLVHERERMKAKAREEDELKRRRKEDFVRRRQKEAWDHASQARVQDDYEYVFDLESAGAKSSADTSATAQWQHAWAKYLQAWERLKTLDIPEDAVVSKLLPWPVLPTKPPTKPHIEDFLRHMPPALAEDRRRLLKVERVRWHPDKIQQRFQGKVDEGTMKVVTGIFQVIDALWSAEEPQRG